MKKYLLLLSVAALAFGSCSDDAGVYEEFEKPDITNPNPEEVVVETDYEKYTLGELGDAAGVLMGAAVTKNDLDKSATSSIVYKHFKSVTFGNEMKNDAIMQANGRLDFTRSDQMVTDIINNNVQLFGHVLGWHSQQRYAYMNGLIEGAAVYGEELKAFIDFESEASTLSAWGDMLVSAEKVTDPNLVFAGDYALAVKVNAGEVYQAQVNVNIPNAVVGQNYNVCFWMKAEKTGQIRLSTTDNQYLYDPTEITTEYRYYTAPVKVKELAEDGSYSVRFDMAAVENTYYFDNVRVVEAEEQTPTVNYISKDDILGDGTFEDYADFNAAYTGQGWNNYGNENITVVSEGAHNGNNAVQVDATVAVENTWTHQVIWPATAAAKVDGAHVIGMWVKAVEFADPTATQGNFQMKVTTPASGDKYYNPLTVTNEWSFIAFTLDDTVHQIKAGDTIAVTLQCGGTDAEGDIRQMRFLIDDMQIYPVGSDPDTGGGSGESFINEGSIVAGGDFDGITTFDELVAAGWTSYSSPNVTLDTTTAHSGTNSILLDNSAGSANKWDVQLITPEFITDKDGQYTVGMWAKADILDREFQMAIAVDGATLYKDSSWGAFPKVGEEWIYISYAITADEAPMTEGSIVKVTLQVSGDTATTMSKLWIDDFQIYPTPTTEAATAAALAKGQKSDFYLQSVELHAATRAAGMESTTKTVSESANDRIDVAFKAWINGMMAQYGDKVYAWDAINELFDDGTNAPRDNKQQIITDGRFFWGDWMGGAERWAVKTFQYAKAANPNAVLYINDYNLEYSTGKLDAFCAFVEKYKELGLIDGVGTQVHTSINVDMAKVDNMFKKMAATGLKVRISEMDVDANPSHSLTSLTDDVAKKQAEVYRAILESYFTNVPAAQRGGITVWGVLDSGSWLNDDKGNAYALLFDDDGAMKPAFKAVYDVLLKYSGLE